MKFLLSFTLDRQVTWCLCIQFLLFTYFVLQDMLPEYIPMRVAESILFAGKAVQVLRNPSPSFQSGDAVHPQMPKSFQKIHGLAGRFHFQREPAINMGMGEDLLPQSEADKIEAMLLNLKVFMLLDCWQPFMWFTSMVLTN